MPTLPFTPTYRQQLIDALLDAFASRDELDRLVWAAFDQNPQTIIAERVNLTRAVEEVVEEAASREGGVRRLVTVATQERIENRTLAQMAQAWQSVDFEIVSKPNTTPGQTIQTDGGFVVLGDVNAGGDFVGRDKVTITEETAYNVIGLTNPYLGLRSFEYKDRSIYGGREQLAKETAAKLTDPKSPQNIIFVTGASGSGKSSFAQAGLIPSLEEHYMAYQKEVRYAIFRPSSQPIVMLTDALQKLHPALTPETLTTTTPKDQVNLLIIDQFEELFIQSEASQRAPFYDFLTNLPSFSESRTHILITLRVDYLDELFAIQPLWAIAKDGVELRAMKDDDLRSAIQKSLQVLHPQKRFAPELLDRLVQDAGEDAALLPLLQVTLVELWKSGKLVLTSYHSLTNSIRQRADTVYDFSDYDKAAPQIRRHLDEQEELMTILLALINVSADGDDRRSVRQRRTRYELEQGSAQRSKLIEELVNARLLSAAREIRNGESVEVIDIIHESLINNWDRLRSAIEEQRQQLQRRARFKLWLGEWLRNGRQDGALLTDLQLAEAQALAEQHDIELQDSDAHDFFTRSWQYLEANHQRELENQRQRTRILRNAVIVASLLFLLAASAAGFSYYLNQRLKSTNAELDGKNQDLDQANGKLNDTVSQLNQTVDTLDATNIQLQQTISETTRLAHIAISRQLAVQSADELGKGHYEPAILLALEAGRSADTFEAFTVIREAIANPWHSRIIIQGHSGVKQATWSKNGNKILTLYYTDNAMAVLDATTGRELVKVETGKDSIAEATWSPDESKILTFGENRTPRIWDAITGQALVALTGHIELVDQAIWNQDGSKVLTACKDGTARIWDAKSGKVLAWLIGGPIGAIEQAMWSSDESKILTTSIYGTALMWDATTGQELFKIERVYKATWSQDGNKFSTSDGNGSTYVWDAVTGKELIKLDGETSSEAVWIQNDSAIVTTGGNGTHIWNATTGKELDNSSGFNASDWLKMTKMYKGKILTINNNGTVSVTDAATGLELFKLTGHSGKVLQADWNLNGNRILTRSDDGTARIWDLSAGKEFASFGENMDSVWEAKWNQDQSKILVAGENGRVHILDAATGNQLVEFKGHTGGVNQAIWSRDESKILTRSADYTARIWDSHTGKEIVKFGGNGIDIVYATWSRDENKLLTINSFDTARIWDTNTGQVLIKFGENKLSVWQAMWNQDESKVLTSSDDNTVRIWNANTGQSLVELEGVNSAKWNQDGTKILTFEPDHTVHILDATTSQEFLKFEDPQWGIKEAKWSPDKSKLLTISGNGTTHIWNAITGQKLVDLTSYIGDWGDALWNQNANKILIRDGEQMVEIWDAITGQRLAQFAGHTDRVRQAIWSQDESKILTSSEDGTARIWDSATGHELVRLAGHTARVGLALWNQDESEILTASSDGTVRIWYVHMTDLLAVTCTWVPRNFTWTEWGTYMAGDYHPTCSNAAIPLDVIKAIQDKAQEDVQANYVLSATKHLEELNGWLKENGQFDSFGVDVQALVAEVAATTEAVPSPTVTPSPSATPIPATQPASPLTSRALSPLATPTTSAP